MDHTDNPDLRGKTVYSESKHLRKRAERDPRLDELLDRFEAKGMEGNAQRKVAHDIVKASHKAMAGLSNQYSPAEEEDILRFAAYLSDHCYASLFSAYLTTPDEHKHREYAAMIERIVPIIADLQPAVAIGFAPQILELYAQQGKKAEVESLFATIAENHPAEVMKNFQRLKGFANYDQLAETAQAAVEAQASTSPSHATFAEDVRARREADALTTQHGRIS